MGYRILWSDFALDQAAEFFDFIAEENPAAAKRVIENLFDRVEALAEHPFLGRSLSEYVDSSLRRFVVGTCFIESMKLGRQLTSLPFVTSASGLYPKRRLDCPPPPVFRYPYEGYPQLVKH